MEKKSVAVLEKVSGFKNDCFLFDVSLKCAHCGENIQVNDADYYDINFENTARCSTCNQDTVIDFSDVKPVLDGLSNKILKKGIDKKMKKFIADVTIEKTVVKDNWEHGVIGDYETVYYDSFFIEFYDKEDLKHQLAKWASERFAIDEKDFVEYVTNEIEENRFDYSQNEDADGNYKVLTKDDQNGYLCDYTFTVCHVMQEIDYKFS